MLTHGSQIRTNLVLRALFATMLVALVAFLTVAPALAQEQQDDGDSTRVGVKADQNGFEVEISEGDDDKAAATATSSSGPWYTTPLGIGILGLVAFLIIVVAVMAIRGSGSGAPSTTIVRE